MNIHEGSQQPIGLLFPLMSPGHVHYVCHFFLFFLTNAIWVPEKGPTFVCAFQDIPACGLHAHTPYNSNSITNKSFNMLQEQTCEVHNNNKNRFLPHVSLDFSHSIWFCSLNFWFSNSRRFLARSCCARSSRSS